MNALVVAPNMTDLNASGGGSDDYSKLPKGNLDVTGEYFIWTANAGTEPARCVHRPHPAGEARRVARRADARRRPRRPTPTRRRPRRADAGSADSGSDARAGSADRACNRQRDAG